MGTPEGATMRLKCRIVRLMPALAVWQGGISKKLDRLTAGEFAIRAQADRAAYVMAGLSFDTKFNLAKSIELPWNDYFFAVPSDMPHGQTPKLGSLHIGMGRALEAAARAAGLI